jgi:AmmeMemoRadiSam system protein A
VEARELPRLAVHISVLSPLEPLPAPSEAELLARLRPGTDGLVLSEGALASTFLPSVWESLPSPDRFLAELKRKAGLPADHWSPTLRFQRYTVEEFE